ncbi:protein BUNDLE SHEATH DEFECTIVE 2, chloroplastic-like isoform X2 [Euphorbia lathyris]|uniref:protein BUNDLE SHEATH DEFECTIVE 2, chloroplastic-like isoform X2 n=1 Tax=Euphorbia lathyris TaxID=212925 RepID=UPI00331372EA
MAMASSSHLLLQIRANQGICRHSSYSSSKHGFFTSISTAKRCRVKTKAAAAAPSNQNPKRKSVICDDCDGNGAVLCSQCKGDGVNSVDFFNGQFKAGESCWLCGGRKEMLCGNCNGAGFLGGFLSTQDE